MGHVLEVLGGVRGPGAGGKPERERVHVPGDLQGTGGGWVNRACGGGGRECCSAVMPFQWAAGHILEGFDSGDGDGWGSCCACCM